MNPDRMNPDRLNPDGINPDGINPDGINPDGINPDIERQLKITVERAVRPVKTWEQRKKMIRQELLAHLAAIYREELDRSGDEQVALQAARLRFGVPAKLTQELQRGVPGIPRWAAWLNDRFRIDGQASPRRNALRLTSFWFCELFLMFAACDVVVILKGLSPWPMLAILLTPLLMLTLMAYVALEGAFEVVLNRAEDKSYWKSVRGTCWKLGVLGFIYKLVLSSQTTPQWERNGAQEAGMLVLCTVAVPALFWLVMWTGREEFFHQVEWSRLDLGEE